MERDVRDGEVGGTLTAALLDGSAGTLVATESRSTTPGHSRSGLDALELFAEQLGRPLHEVLADCGARCIQPISSAEVAARPLWRERPGPQIVSDPLCGDMPVACRHHCCPGCWTNVHSAVVQADLRDD